MRGVDATVDDARRHPQHGGVTVDDLFDAGSLHLDHDMFAGLEDGAVGLTDRRRRERLEVEGCELLLHRRAQLTLEHFTHLVGADGAGRRLELLELGGDRVREEITTGRRDLPELHEHPAAVLERETQAPRELGRRELRRRRVVLESTLAREAEDLTKAPERREPALRRRDRMQQPAEAVTLPELRLEDHVEDQPDEHGDQHAEEQRQGQHVLDLRGRADVVVLDDRGDANATHPPEEAGDERAAPTPVDAEQPAAEPADHDDERHAVDQQRPEPQLDRDRCRHPGILRRAGRVRPRTAAATVRDVTATAEHQSTDTPEQASFRAEVRAFLAANSAPKQERSPWAITYHTSSEAAADAFDRGRAWQKARSTRA